MNYKGTTGNDNFDGTSDGDVFNMAQGGNDTVNGGGGNDVFRFGASFDANDSVTGGSGVDTLVLDGDYSAEMFVSSTMLKGVENVTVTAGHSYSFAIFDGVIAHGASMTFKGQAVAADGFLGVDGSYLSAASADTTLIVYGGAGTTYFTGGFGTNIFHGGSGDDFVYFGADLGHDDRLDGGGGSNTLQLVGDYSAGITFTAAMMHNFHYLSFQDGYDYKVTLTDANLAAGQTLEVFGANLSIGEALIFNGGHETDGHFQFYDGCGNDVLTGGQQSDTFFAGSGGNDKFYGQGGADTFNLYDHFTAADHIDGGDGTDEIDLSGDYSHGVTLKATTVVNVETIFFTSGSSYKIVVNDGNVAVGQSMSLNADLLAGTDTLYADASAETDGHYYLGGGAGGDTLIGGQAGNTLYGGLGQDTITAGLGADVFQYLDVGESTHATRDILSGFDAQQDSFDLPFNIAVGGVDSALEHGLLSQAHFDANLAAAVDAVHLAAGHAVLFTPDSGNLAGHTFLIVDANGAAGYQAGQDFVFQLEGALNLENLGASDFH